MWRSLFQHGLQQHQGAAFYGGNAGAADQPGRQGGGINMGLLGGGHAQLRYMGRVAGAGDVPLLARNEGRRKCGENGAEYMRKYVWHSQKSGMILPCV